MIDLKKIISLLVVSLLLFGCGANTAKNAVETYLKKYKTLDSEVLVDLESTIEKENLNDHQSEAYRDILKKQYQDLSYEITEEEYNKQLIPINYDLAKYNVVTNSAMIVLLVLYFACYFLQIYYFQF